MKTPTNLSLRTTMAVALVSVTLPTHAQPIPGIPEPGLVLYGQVRNAAVNHTLLTYGTLRWTVTPAVGPAVTVVATLTNLNDQFSYVARVPFETVLPGFTLSPGALALSAAPAGYNRSATVAGTVTALQQPAAILLPALNTFTFGGGDRGRLERVDMDVSLPFLDTDGDGLDDNWERAYFGGLTQGAEGDPDGDGLKNGAEYQAGNNPVDSQSRFAFIEIQPQAPGGVAVTWASVAGTKYRLERSSELNGGFAPISPVIEATGGQTTFADNAATGPEPKFYRVRVATN